METEAAKDVGGYNYTHPRIRTSILHKKPGPEYALPPLVGYPGHDTRSTHQRLPAYSIGIRTDIERKDPGPGPAAYYPNQIKTASAFSMAARVDEKSKFESPGPAKYSVGKSHISRPPAYSFGLKGKDASCNGNPGPNAYALPPPHIASSTAKAPAYTLRKRPDSLFKGSAAPGPGEYQVPNVNKYLNQQPQWSMSTGAQLPSDATLKPSPSDYFPNIDVAKKSAPRFTFGMKHHPMRGEFVNSGNIPFDDE